MAHTKETRARAWAKMKERRRLWFEKNGPCQSCGTADQLEMHHKDPKSKVSNNVWSWEQSKMEAELSKCLVLCRLCHDSIHRPPLGHGQRGYDRGCRCEVCVAKQRERVYKWRMKSWGSISSKPRKFAGEGIEPST